MLHVNKNTTSTSNVPQGASPPRHGKSVSASRKGSETHGKKAHRSFFSKRVAILFIVSAYIFLKVSPAQKEKNARIKMTSKDKKKPCDDIDQPYEEPCDDIDQPYEEPCDDIEGVYSDEQWEEAGGQGDYEEQEEEAILEEWTPDEQEVQEEVHYDGERNIEHDAREQVVDNGDILTAEESVTESTESIVLDMEPLVQAKEAAAKDNAESVTGATKVPGPATTQESDEQVGVKRHDVLADAIYDDVSTVPKSHDALDNDDKTRQGRKQQRMGKGHTIEKYEGNVAEDREKYGIHRSIEFHYEMSCFDERLSDSEINKKLEQMEEEPHTWELLSLYWQSYRNERSKYLNQKLLNPRNNQPIETIQKYSTTWNKCEEIINNNLTKQHEHVSEVFYTIVEKENWNTHEFQKILYDFRDSWKQVTLKTADECMAIIEEPVSLEVIYVENDPRKIGKGDPGFTVPVMPYDSKGKLDSKVGADELSVSSQNEEEDEKKKKEPRGFLSKLRHMSLTRDESCTIVWLASSSYITLMCVVGSFLGKSLWLASVILILIGVGLNLPIMAMRARLAWKHSDDLRDFLSYISSLRARTRRNIRGFFSPVTNIINTNKNWVITASASFAVYITMLFFCALFAPTIAVALFALGAAEIIAVILWMVLLRFHNVRRRLEMSHRKLKGKTSRKGNKKHQIPEEPSLEGGADMQTPEQNNQLPGSPSEDPFKEPIVQDTEDAKDITQFHRGETKVPGQETTQESYGHIRIRTLYVPADAVPDHILKCLESYEEINYNDTEKQKQDRKMKKAGHTIEKYEGKVTEDREKYGIHRSIEFHYEMSCFDERLKDSEINKRLEEMEEEPHTWELLSLYWQSYRNERSAYFALKKYLKEKFLEFQKEQTIPTPATCINKWEKCEEIASSNFSKQHEHVSEVFYTMVTKEKLSRDEFKEMLNDFRASWKEVIIKTAVECIAQFEEPIYLEVIYVQNVPHVFGLRVVDGTVPVIAHHTSGELDSSVGAQRSSQVSQNEEQAEKAEKKPEEPSLEGGVDKETPEQNKGLASPTGDPSKETAPVDKSEKSEATKEPEVAEKQESPGKHKLPWSLKLPEQPEVPKKPEVPGKTEVPKKPEVPGKTEVPKKPETPGKPKLPWSHKLPKKP
ncbi:hypothetical protein AK88_05326 [Plasmodium fragile]|uniref:Plasmodium RESA N-terminal domain-containing protein n=1 Tax=Plasmodium fragile TaxID=5857 RepID=A0A0D9QDY0_PLAFR|nr:uncharacterized protein AK88_05326 [Plasmodium fragile]KJP85042.1 hypothetical protein AK88_05326 [Plasmodium fragile]